MIGTHKNVRAQFGVIALGTLLAVAPASAVDNGCTQWDMSGKWSAVQSNFIDGLRQRTTAFMNLQQTGSQLQGSASHVTVKDGGILVGTDEVVSVIGPAVGSIHGDAFELTVYWNNDTVGFYTGQIGPQGLIVGTTYDKNAPFRNSPLGGSRPDTAWHSDRVADCRSGASAPPPANSKPSVALGRVKSTGAPTPTVSICEAARSARARNSPAAPGLARQCAAHPVSAVDPFNATAILHTASPPDAAAPPLPDLQALAAKGESVANQDPLAMQLRALQGQGQRLRGFDIGMAAAQGDTAPGPGKQRIHDAIGAVEQRGYETAVAFSLQRNANADHARIGAKIAEADADVEQARNSDPDPFFQLGFDIATGIFGDQALGADGNTATGPGSNRIRESLGPESRLGFDAGVALYLGRNQ